MPCQNDSSDYPTLEEFQISLGYPAWVLYGLGAFTSCLLLIQFMVMSLKFLRYVPHNRIRQTFWINSVYSVVGTLTTLSIIFPKSGPFVWSIYRIMVGRAMSKFVELLLLWVGGQKTLLKSVDTENINFRSPPCCFCLCCPTEVKISEKKLVLMKVSVYQVLQFEILKLFNFNLNKFTDAVCPSIMLIHRNFS